MLFLRTCKKDGTSSYGYVWNLDIGAINEAPDYNDKPECGGGLHGIPNGIGDSAYLDFSDESIGVVFSAESDIVEFDDKAKVRRAKTEFVGDLSDCAQYIHDKTGLSGIIKQIIAVGDKKTATAGDYGHATAGDEGQATAGDHGQATAGYKGQATAGDHGHATAGDCGHATAGDRGHATAGYKGHATAGDCGHATAGDYGHATAGDCGHATAGDEGQATAGDYGHATAGDRGHATAGDGGMITIEYYDGNRYRMKVGYLGEDGLKPNVAYRLNDSHKFEEV